jgi:hypothetical protein
MKYFIMGCDGGGGSGSLVNCELAKYNIGLIFDLSIVVSQLTKWREESGAMAAMELVDGQKCSTHWRIRRRTDNAWNSLVVVHHSEIDHHI